MVSKVAQLVLIRMSNSLMIFCVVFLTYIIANDYFYTPVLTILCVVKIFLEYSNLSFEIIHGYCLVLILYFTKDTRGPVMTKKTYSRSTQVF